MKTTMTMKRVKKGKSISPRKKISLLPKSKIL